MYCGITGEKNCKCLNPKEPISAMQVDLQSTLRKLFTDHGVYTSFVLKSITSHLPDTKVILARLLQNQKDIGDQLKPIIGEEMGTQLTRALTNHIQLAGDCIKAATNKDKQLNHKIKLLFDNSDQVAQLLTNINSSALPYSATQQMFHEHNQFVLDMTVARLKGEYEKEQRLYDAYYNELLEMADAIYVAL